jgi:hypothetical protein
MNIGSVDPNFTGSRALAGPGNAHNLLLDQAFGTQGNFITQKPKAYNLLSTIKTLMLLEQVQSKSNFFFDGQMPSTIFSKYQLHTQYQKRQYNYKSIYNLKNNGERQQRIGK